MSMNADKLTSETHVLFQLFSLREQQSNRHSTIAADDKNTSSKTSESTTTTGQNGHDTTTAAPQSHPKVTIYHTAYKHLSRWKAHNLKPEKFIL